MPCLERQGMNIKKESGTMKKWMKITIATVAVAGIVFLLLPHYAQQALIHLMPVIDDDDIFCKNTVHAPSDKWIWGKSKSCNTYILESDDAAYLDSLKTVSFLVIQNDSIIFEHYYEGWNDSITSNLYSATKSIVSLLVGAAIDEGKIKSIDDPVGNYLPEYNTGRKKDVTIRHLLTMSARLDWDEAYSSLFSATTHGYYGNDLYDFVTGLDITGTPGEQYTYRSGETQILAFVVEAATGETLSSYAERKLWQPMQAERDAYWLLDRKDGDEKAFCCFHTTARDAARFGKLMLNYGDWNGHRIISEKYMKEAMTPASYLKDQWGKDPLDYYGFQFWIMHYKGMTNPYMRGMLGQYVIAIPDKNAIVVRLGKKRSDEYIKEITTDILRYTDIGLKILENSGK